MKLKIADRDIEQESRVEAANAIYATLINIPIHNRSGQAAMWQKYNDYGL
jgi:hypothetical protein